jgi:hypothetical protein
VTSDLPEGDYFHNMPVRWIAGVEYELPAEEEEAESE